MTVTPTGEPGLGPLLAEAAEVAAHARADNTTRAYAADWRRFVTWCADHDVPSLPATPSAVVAYLADAARDGRPGGYKHSTLARWVTTINVAHRDAGHPKPGDHPAVRAVLAGLSRQRGTRPRRVAPLLLDDVRSMVAHMDTTVWPAGVAATRDSVVILAGFAGAFRRSELVGLDLGDVTFDRSDGVHLLVRRSKTDQAGQGQIKPAPFGQTPGTCVPCAVARWLRLLAAAHQATPGGQRAAVMRVLLADNPDRHVCRGTDLTPTPGAHGDLGGPLLRPVTRSGLIRDTRLTGDAVAGIIKRRAGDAGLDPAEFSGHSPRAGFVTEALRHGATAHAIMRQTGHRDPATVEVYARERAPMEGNAVKDLGL